MYTGIVYRALLYVSNLLTTDETRKCRRRLRVRHNSMRSLRIATNLAHNLTSTDLICSDLSGCEATQFAVAATNLLRSRPRRPCESRQRVRGEQ